MCRGDSSLDAREAQQSGEHDFPLAAREVLETLSVLGGVPEADARRRP